MLKRFGPGFFVAAAFVGPGTVTTASAAGASHAYALLWAVVFSTLATVILQEMSARLGLATRLGLGEAFRAACRDRAVRLTGSVLIMAAIGLGNAAFEMGNFLGTALALELLTGLPRALCTIAAVVTALVILVLGSYRLIEAALAGMVALMGIVFLLTAVLARPAVGEVLVGALRPDVPAGALMTVIALIGTTVVPYNLFLHASCVQQKWPASLPVEQAIRRSRLDAVVAIVFGGAITASIVVTAATCLGGQRIESVTEMARQLEPLLGKWGPHVFAVGLAAAGLSSAVTAPLAAAYATAGVLGWDRAERPRSVRAMSVVVLLIGALFALLEVRPVRAIIFAQAANGVILPIIAVFLLVIVNRRSLLGRHANGAATNLLGGAVVLVTALLGGFQVLSSLGVLR